MMLDRKQDGNLGRIEGSMVSALCSVQLKDRNRAEDLMLMLDLNEIINQLTIAFSVLWYWYVLRRQGSHVLRRELDYAVEGQWKKEG